MSANFCSLHFSTFVEHFHVVKEWKMEGKWGERTYQNMFRSTLKFSQLMLMWP